jgi:hypothetical protein
LVTDVSFGAAFRIVTLLAKTYRPKPYQLVIEATIRGSSSSIWPAQLYRWFQLSYNNNPLKLPSAKKIEN